LENPDWRSERYAASLNAFWGAEAARRQGEAAFRQFHQALLRAKHQDGRDLAEPETLLAAAKAADLDLAGFQNALADPACLERLAQDHTRAVGRQVFGTPTLVFPDAEPVYLKLGRVLTPQEALEFWESFYSTAAGKPYVLEIKRPH
jgi:2-hydroxychromene-2-carboxylate isomerase